jgi:hypothetical protein
MKQIGLISWNKFTIYSILILLVIAVMITMPNPVLGLLNSTDNFNKTNTKDWNYYLANSHNLATLNATGNLKDCSVTNMIGPCWDSPYGSVRP